MSRTTRGTIEAQVANAASLFQREQQGRGPTDVRVYLNGDLIVVRSRGIFTKTETKLLQTEEGRRLIKSARLEMRGIMHLDYERLVASIVGCMVARSYGDLNVDAAEQIDVFVLEEDVEKRLLRQDLEILGGIGNKRHA